jgi:two-component system cell cycle sensor histidine kinase PleC
MPRLGERRARRVGLFSAGPRRWIILGTLLTVVAIAAAAALQLRRTHAAALVAAENQSRSLIKVVTGTVAGELRDTLARAQALEPLIGLGGIAATDPMVVNAFKVRDSGEVIADRAGPVEAQRLLNDQAILTAIGNSPSGAAVRFNEPGETQGALALGSRLAEDANLVLVLRQEAVSRMLTAALRDRPEALILVDAKDRLIASSHSAPAWLAQILDDLPVFGQKETPIRYVTRADGVSILAAAAYVPGMDVKIVSLNRASAGLNEWLQSLPLYAFLILGPSLLGAGLAWALLEQMERRARTDFVLRRTEQRFELAISGAKCGIWDWDLRTGRIYWSAAMNQLLDRGRQPAIMTREEILGLLHPEDLGSLDAIEDTISAGETHYDQTLRLRRTDGSYLPLRVKGQLFHGVVASADRLIGIGIDVSDQRAADQGRQTAEDRLRIAIESAGEAFVLWDAHDRLVLSNKRFLDVYGIPAAEPGEPRVVIMGRAKHPPIPQTEPAPGAAAVAPADGPAGAMELQRAGERWLLISDRRLRGGERVSVATDITALKKQEDELVRRGDELTKTVSELELSQAQLEAQAAGLNDLMARLEEEKLRAESANRAKSDFLANMSHELRTPLNAILGFSDVMRSAVFGPLPGKYSEYASDIHRSGQQLLDLINDILAMAKLEAGKLTLETGPVDVPQLLNDAVHAAEPQAKAQGLSITVAAEPMGEIDADRRAVRQVLMNLLSNATKFTPSGGAITVAAAELHDHVRISVTDTGAGIPAAELPRIVKPFERIGSVRASGGKKGGAGLGLAVSKALIEMQRGQFEIDSKEGVGTCVSFTLPLSPRQPAAQAQTKPTADAAAAKS